MWLLGHLALGYFSSLFTSKIFKEKYNLYVVFILSLAPDLDEFFRGYIVHRGPTHSILVAIICFIPIFLIFRKGFTYFASLASHSLIGDFFVPPLQLFWPISNAWYGAPPQLQLKGGVETIVEVLLFLSMLAVIIWRSRSSIKTYAKDLK